ncbi:MAG: 30S ribosomal protein S8 [Candidatus Pacebacteria bacterium]|nr:30S ribosomal protein S8 [Candidatus Paceibacterota bacterium]
MTDPVADMLNTIKNAQAVNHPTVEVVFSNFKYEIAKLLERQGFISGIDKKGRKNRKTMEITLKYEDKIPAISGLKKVSKPGQRIYVNSTRIKRVKDGHGMAVISTSKGLMTDKEARKQKRGGEILCEIW